MKTCHLVRIVCLLALVWASPAWCYESVKVTYVANEGFLLQGSQQKILIDAIFSNGNGKYHAPSTAVLTQERSATAPFDGIDLILVTHKHDDHVNPAYLAEHLLKDSKAVLVCPSQVDDLLKTQTGYSSFQNRVVAIPAGTIRLDTVVQGIRLGILPFRHPNNFTTINDLGYVFDLDGIRFFHTGDAQADDLAAYQQHGLAGDSVNVAFFPRWYFNTEFGTKGSVIMRLVAPSFILPMHIPSTQYAAYKTMADTVAGIVRPYFLENPMDTVRLTKDGIYTGTREIRSTDGFACGEFRRGVLTIRSFSNSEVPFDLDVFSPTGLRLWSLKGCRSNLVSIHLGNALPFVVVRMISGSKVCRLKLIQE